MLIQRDTHKCNPQTEDRKTPKNYKTQRQKGRHTTDRYRHTKTAIDRHTDRDIYKACST